MLSHFIVGDPIQCAFTLQVVAETAFTNIVFVALPDVGARNGDFTLPTTYLSVQSDEARHISNGYATLLTVLQDDHNAPLIERDLQQAFWINHAYLDVFAGDHGVLLARPLATPSATWTSGTAGSRDDWYRAYVLKLGKLGLELPGRDLRARARAARQGLVHNATCSATPPGRSPSGASRPRRARLRVVRDRYPGWYAEYGAVLGGVPRDDRPAAVPAPADHGARERPAVLLDLPDAVRARGGHLPPGGRRPHALLLLEGVPLAGRVEPGPLRRRPQLLRPLPRLGARRRWSATSGFVRADGETLIAQPHLDDDRMWTLGDLAEHGLHIQSPNIGTAEELGLPSGDSVGLADPERPHRRRAAGGRAVEQVERAGRAGERGDGRLAASGSQQPMSPRVVFEPIGEKIDCDDDETVLDAAFRHGYNLVYGCREGQCSACKCLPARGRGGAEAATRPSRCPSPRSPTATR